MAFTREFILTAIGMFIFLGALIFFFGLPISWLVISSITPHALTPEFKWPKNPSLVNYIEALYTSIGGVHPYVWIINSLIVSSVSATIVLVVSLFAAYVLTRFSFKGQEAMVTAFVIFRLIPTILVAIPLMFLFTAWNALNNLAMLSVVLAAIILPFGILMMDSYFRSLPTVYEEAAMIDGCSKFGAFMRITLPLAAPGLIAVWLLAFVFSWSEFVIPLMLIRDVHYMVASVGLYYFYGQYGRIEYGKLSAFSIVYAIPMIVIFFVTQKYFKRGVAGLVSR